MEMADYLGIDVRTEYDLLWIAKQAVSVPAVLSCTTSAKYLTEYML